MGRPTRETERAEYLRGCEVGRKAEADSIGRREPATQIVEGLDRGAYWHGTHRGLAFKVNQHWGYTSGRGSNAVKWCFYIYVREDALPMGEDGKHDRECVRYVRGWTTDCNWVIGHEGRNGMVIEYGCDFSHLGQEDEIFTADEIARYARQTIDRILEAVPALLVQHWRIKGLITQAEWVAEEERCKADRAAAEVIPAS